MGEKKEPGCLALVVEFMLSSLLVAAAIVAVFVLIDHEARIDALEAEKEGK